MLYINNILMPEPKLNGVSIKKEKVWSKNTTRTSNAVMIGDIVRIIRTGSIEWPTLTHNQVRMIENEISNTEKSFVPVKYIDEKGDIASFQAYFGTPSYQLYSWADGISVVNSAKVDFIEK